jgi:hypothetical protein
MDIPRQFQHLDFHVSPRENRASIEREGLKPLNHRWMEEDDGSNDAKPGIYTTNVPEADYGDDIWGISNHHKYENFMNSVGDYAFSEPIDISDVKRVGHFKKTINGAEVHWHKEEDCPDDSR